MEIDALEKELLLFVKIKEEVKDLQVTNTSSGLTEEMNVPKSQDLSKIIMDIWTKYD